MNTRVRYPAVAGTFYPADPNELNSTVNALLQAAELPKEGTVRAIVVPHASLQFSGETAAGAYRSIDRQSRRTVFLMGNAHAYLFDGIALDSHDSWRTPLGYVPVNTALNTRLMGIAPTLCHELDIAHHSDHILEVQLPFLQRTLNPGFSLLPILFGNNPPGIHHEAAEMLLTILQPDDMIIVSTDLSHYPSYSNANSIDRSTIEHIVDLDLDGLETHRDATMEMGVPGEITLFCSPDALKTLILIARQLGWKALRIAYHNSGDVPHDDRQAVVGYGAVAFYET